MAVQQPIRQAVRLYLENGSVFCYYYHAPGATRAVIWLGGVGGGMDSPAGNLFDDLADELFYENISSLRIRYRVATDLETSVEDALVGIQFLERDGIREVALVGYSFGGAVALQAGAAAPAVVTVVGIASQSYGTSAAHRITPRPLLLVHGAADDVLPSSCSELIEQRALEPKRLIVLPGADHCFTNARDELRSILLDWLGDKLGFRASYAA